MREQLVHYIDLLFAGSQGTQDIQQEILQNTLDRFDDLVASGKTPEAAYSLAIAGIGDIGEILNGSAPADFTAPQSAAAPQNPEDMKKSKLLKAISTGLYIICPVPLFIIGNELGMCLMLLVIAAATILKIMGSNGQKETEKPITAQQKMRNSIDSVVWTLILVIYFIISFATGAWYITWLMFPIGGTVQGLVNAILDLKEANSHEK